jgi:hypothetical protein
MAIKVVCDVCQEELIVRGATLYGPPLRAAGAGMACVEQHLCEPCYLRLQQVIANLRSQQKALTRERAADVPADIVLIGLRKTTKSHVQKELQREGFVVEVAVFEPGRTRGEGLVFPSSAFVVGLKKDAGLIQFVRQQATTLGDKVAEGYFDRGVIQRELGALEKLCMSRDWPMVDASGRPFKETAAEITELYRRHEQTKKTALQDSDG